MTQRIYNILPGSSACVKRVPASSTSFCTRHRTHLSYPARLVCVWITFFRFFTPFVFSSSLLIYSIRRCDEPKRVKKRPWEEAVEFVFKRKCFTMPQPWTFYPGNDSKQFSIWTFLEVCLLIIPISDRFGKSNLDRFIFVLFCLIFPFWLRIITTAAKTDTYPCRILLLLLFCFFFGFLFWTKIIEWRGKPKMGVINRGTFLFACLSVFCLFLFTIGRP